jgi:hypothetical protein
VSGELEVLDGDRTFTARSGDFIFVPRGNRHRFTNTGLHTTKLLFKFTPGGVEKLFAEGGDEPQPGVAPPVWDLKASSRRGKSSNGSTWTSREFRAAVITGQRIRDSRSEPVSQADFRGNSHLDLAGRADLHHLLG